ncbi:MAG: prealbumin-like fold domain-containing protein [Clostridiales bacterium]|nr:prealbumin-like fold domain-containing protein [Clostridiales bacterium]
MKKLGACMLFTLCLALLCQTAFAVSFSQYGDAIPFTDAHGFTGSAADGNGVICSNLWLGTVEAPVLGKAYLVSETPVNGGLTLYGDAGYRSYTGDLPIQPSPACTLPQGQWTVRFAGGVPFLYRDGAYQPQMTGVTITEAAFSIPVQDQYGTPVAGAVFELESITWGGNDSESLGVVTTGADGLLRFPRPLSADRVYWFTQSSAPAGYKPMTPEMMDVQFATSGGFRAMTNTSYPNEAYVNVILNPREGSQPATAPTPASAQPPKTGDSSQPLLLFVLATLSGLALLGLTLPRRRRQH